MSLDNPQELQKKNNKSKTKRTKKQPDKTIADQTTGALSDS